MKTKLFIILAITIVFEVISAFWYMDYKKVEEAYTQAIEHIKHDEFDLAITKLSIANKEELTERKFYYEFIYNKSSASYYKDSAYLYTYSLIMNEYNTTKSMDYINKYLKLIPNNYSKTLSTEINTFKAKFNEEYNEYLLEQERQRQIEEDEKIRNSVPFVGMSETRINDTILGTDYEITHNSDWENGKKIQANVYRLKKGNAIIFVARCLKGYVDSVRDFRDDPWVLPNTGSGYGRKKSYNDAPYNYSTPEDFYDDYYDYFWDYEEAEDYYNNHRKTR